MVQASGCRDQRALLCGYRGRWGSGLFRCLPLPFDEAHRVSTTVVDRNGKLLRAFAMADGRWRLPAHAKTDVDPGYLKLLLAYEDKRFWSHLGVDPLALSRAAFQLATRGHIVSGGSTITMQLARLMEPRQERSVGAKLRQAVRALQIERQLSKDEILDLYLTLAPFGGNLEGVRAASFAYFGKEPKRLSLAEAALLVALPQSPETRRLDRHPEAAHLARDRVVARMMSEGQVSAEDADRAKLEPVPRLRKPMPFLAPHATDQSLAILKDTPLIKLTLDSNIQKSLEALRAIARLRWVPMCRWVFWPSTTRVATCSLMLVRRIISISVARARWI